MTADNTPGFERRRNTDRRTSQRDGKFERRKNTCGNCSYYKVQTEVSGLCMKHQTMLKSTDFACTWFQKPTV